MCHTGKCPYENHKGDCTIPWGQASHPAIYPDDAHCVLMEDAQELEAAGLLGDIDVDNAEAITAAYNKMVEQKQEDANLEEALGELVGFEPVAIKEPQSTAGVIKSRCANCPHASTCGSAYPRDIKSSML